MRMHAGVDMRSYNVIYNIVDDIRALMEGKLASVEERTPLGEAEVRAIFGSGSRVVAGCMITEGMCRKGCHAVVRLRILLFITFSCLMCQCNMSLSQAGRPSQPFRPG